MLTCYIEFRYDEGGSRRFYLSEVKLMNAVNYVCSSYPSESLPADIDRLRMEINEGIPSKFFTFDRDLYFRMYEELIVKPDRRNGYGFLEPYPEMQDLEISTFESELGRKTRYYREWHIYPLLPERTDHV